MGQNNKLTLGLVGSDLSNSLSEAIHNEFAKDLNVELDFKNLEVSEKDFKATVDLFFKNKGRGLSITSPFKQAAYEYVDILDDSAKLAKSVNCISIQNNKLVGYNTDGKGLITDLKTKIGQLNDTIILVIGSGGAVRGILSELSLDDSLGVSVWARNSVKVQELVNQFSLQKLSGKYDVIIHATSSKQSFRLDWIEEYCTKNTLMYDIQYKKDQSKTWFCLWADNKGYTNANGRGMVYQQAKLAFDIWKETLED